MKSDLLIWLFPIVFMIHEFEEIILMRWWLGNNKEIILSKYPNLGKRVLHKFESLSVETFSLIVAEEFLIVSFVVLFSVFTSNYNLYVGLLVAYFIHLLTHLSQTVLLRKYTPGIVTTFITGIFCLFVFYWFAESGLLSFKLTFIYCIILTLVVFLNLKFMHYVTRKLNILHAD